MRAALLLAGLLAGCASAPQPRPAVTIPGPVAQQAAGLITQRMLDSGFTVRASSPHHLVFEKPAEGVAAAMIYGSRYDAIPAYRVTFSLAETPESTRIVTDVVAVTNPGSGFERVSPIQHQGTLDSYRRLLDQTAASLAP